MKPKVALKKLASLLQAKSFTSKEAKVLGVSSATLAYYVKIGELVRIGHGVYKSKDAPQITDFRWEDLVDAMSIVRGGVICLISALTLYELTDEIPRQHWIAISNDTSHRATDNIKIIRLRNMELGQTKFLIDGIALPIFDRERTIVDSFRYLSKEVAIKALRSALSIKGNKKISIEKIRKYAKILRFNIEPYLISVLT